MRLLVTLRTSFKAVLKNGKRSFLTMFGIIVGIGAVIAIMSIGRGYEQDTIKSLTDSKEGEVKVTVSFQPNDQNLYETNPNFFQQTDLELVKNIDGVEKAEFPKQELTTTYIKVQVKDDSKDEELVLTTAGDKEMIKGRNVSKADQALANKVVAIDDTLAKGLYDTSANALHRGLEISGQLFTIVGVYKGTAVNSMFSMPLSNIMIPKSTYNNYLAEKNSNSSIELTLKQGVKPNKVTEKAMDILKDKGTMTSLGKYEVYDTAMMSDAIGSILSQITLFISAVAGISLFIAGVGVMNMMYISVSERTKEIGIRRALGATQNSIMMQFLFEGVSLTLIGGIIGYIFGMLLAYGIGSLVKISIHMDLFVVLLAVGISSLIGLIFSVFPARAAAKKDLIDILR